MLPAIFDAKWSNLALGTSRRNASDAQKLVLAARDGGCISCQAHTETTHAHHIQFWSNDGPTDIPNLATLCPHCHNLIHDHNWQVRVSADGHPKLRAPEHLRLPPDPAPANPRPSSTPSSEPEAVGKRPPQVEPVRHSPVERGLCCSTRQNVIALTVPMFDEFIRRHIS